MVPCLLHAVADCDVLALHQWPRRAWLATAGRVVNVTSALVARWCKGALGAGGKAPGLGAMRNLVKAYRLACHYGDPEGALQPARARGGREGGRALCKRLLCGSCRRAAWYAWVR